MSKRYKDYESLETIGLNIRLARLTAGISQKEFALKIATTASYLGSVERGKRNVCVLTLIRIGKALEIPIGDLFEGI